MIKRLITLSTLARLIAAGLLFWSLARHGFIQIFPLYLALLEAREVSGVGSIGKKPLAG